MIKHILAALILPFISLAGTANSQEMNFDKPGSLKALIEQISRTQTSAQDPKYQTPTPRPYKDWTIMVFMNGKNNLARFVLKDINEMEMVGTPANVNLVVQAARMRRMEDSYQGPTDFPPYPGAGGYYPNGVGTPGYVPGYVPSYYTGNHPPPPANMGKAFANDPSMNWVGVRRYLITRDNDTARISSPMLEDLNNVDMGDYRVLKDFITWSKRNFPANNYMLIVWNHGSGWEVKSLKGEGAQNKGISYDDETHNSINPMQLGDALYKTGGVTIYASDACLMQMAEVIYELRISVPIVIGSEETESGDGWAYDYFLKKIMYSPYRLTPDIMARAAVEGYNLFYFNMREQTTMSAAYTQTIEDLRGLVTQWSYLAMASNEKAMLKQAAMDTKRYEGSSDSRDLAHYMRTVAARTVSPALKAKSEEVAYFVMSRIVFKNATNGPEYKNSRGLAIYLPTYVYNPSYSSLAWARNSSWDEFVQWLNAK